MTSYTGYELLGYLAFVMLAAAPVVGILVERAVRK